MKKAIEIFEAFHGHLASMVKKISFNQPEGLVLLGEAIAVEYRCAKFNGGGDGKLATYRHECGRGNLLCTDEEGKQLYILGSKQKITHRGIVQ
jgi:hypothetical protein